MERLSFSYIIGTRQQLNNLTIDSLTVGDSSIKSSQPVRNLGSWFDSHLSMHRSALPHSTTCINIHRIRKFLSRETTEKLVHAFISISIVSSIDYCNSLLYRSPSYQINKLQSPKCGCLTRLWSTVSSYNPNTLGTTLASSEVLDRVQDSTPDL